MEKIINKIYIFIFIYSCWNIYNGYISHEVKMITLKNEIPTYNLRIKKKEKEKRQLDEYFKDIEEAKERIELVAQEVEKLQKQFPSQMSDTKNMQTIKSTAEELNIRNVNLFPGPEESHGFYVSKVYNVKALGTYLQFLIFFEKIAANERLLNVKSLKIVKSDSKQRGRFQLINAEVEIEAYRYNSAFKESRGIKEIEQKYSKGK